MLNEIDRPRSALQSIPVPTDYETWNKVGIEAIASGLTLDDLDEWSATGPNYKGTKDVITNFKRVKTEGGIGPGSLYHRAFAAGWRDPANARNKASQPIVKKALQKPAVDALGIWQRFNEATAEHPYIIAKRGIPNGLRIVLEGDPLHIQGQSVVGFLAAPAWSLAGVLRTIQFIPLNGGKKLNLPGASFDDGMFVVGDLGESDRVYIVEGIGQALPFTHKYSYPEELGASSNP